MILSRIADQTAADRSTSRDRPTRSSAEQRSRSLHRGARAAQLTYLLFLLSLAFAEPARAQGEPTLDSGDTAWLLTSSALVLMMTLPGLALFYGGLVRAKNVLSVLMQCMISAGAVGVLWILLGYSLAFSEQGELIGGMLGDLSAVGLSSIGPEDLRSGTAVPEYVFAMFQGMFAIITPALMAGAFAERMRFGAYLGFISSWLLLVYVPLAHMVWGGGWIASSLGALDFAGGLVVHMSSGFSALAAAILLGKRHGYRHDPMPPHSLPLTVVGAGMLWVGWFGFNGGSALGANSDAGLAFLTTQTAAATAVIGWALIEVLHTGKATVLGAATAAVAGLVAITPACAFVSPLGAIAIGAGASGVCYFAVTVLKPLWGYDDSLDVFGVHGMGGVWGALATGLFITEAALPEGVGWGAQIAKQVLSIGFVAVYSIAISVGILLALRVLLGSLRVESEDEQRGLDLSLHSENAYTLQPAGTMVGHAPAAAPREHSGAA